MQIHTKFLYAKFIDTKIMNRYSQRIGVNILSSFWTNNTKNLTPYVPGEQPENKDLIKLNTNENPYPPSPYVKERIQSYKLDNLRLYPNIESTIIKRAVAKYYGISEKEVFAGNGSDEVLALVFKTFFDSTTKVGFPDVTYSFYPVYCNLYEIPFETVPVKESFCIDFTHYSKELKGIVFANPNAPTGKYVDVSVIEELLKDRPDTLFIVDEAYIDFGGESCIPLVSKYDNLLIIQTLSKARSLAGLRIGLAIGCEGLIEGIVRVKDSFNSYPLDSLAQSAAEAAFKDDEYFNKTRQKIIDTRDWTQNELVKLGVNIIDSKANFIFASIPGVSGPDALSKLREEGFLVRNFSMPKISDWLRITIGTREDMEYLIQKIKMIMTP